MMRVKRSAVPFHVETGLMNCEKFDQVFATKVVSVFMMNEPNTRSAIKIDRIFGTKVSVCSCMEVTVWKIEITRPTTRDMRSIGAAQRMTL